MTLRIRQVVLAAHTLAPIVDDLEAVLGVQVAFRDPQVAEFGLHNAVMPVGDQFLEVVSPIRIGTAAGRLLERRGDSGYMILLQTDDLDRCRARLDKLAVRVVWSAAYPDIRAVHLHPKDIGGTIVSLDQPDPPASWRWGGPEWQKFVSHNGARSILQIDIEAVDPETMAHRWTQVLGLPDPAGHRGAWHVALADGGLRFVAARAHDDGLSAIKLALPAPDAALARARSRGLAVVGGTVTIGGTRFQLASAEPAD